MAGADLEKLGIAPGLTPSQHSGRVRQLGLMLRDLLAAIRVSDRSRRTSDLHRA